MLLLNWKCVQKGCVALLMLGVLASTTMAAEILVPESYATIQAALDASSNGDTILVGPGEYVENIRIQTSVVIQSRAGAENTIVRPLNTENHAFRVRVDNVTLEGFTVAGGTIAGAAAILVNPEVRGCRLISNIVGTPAVSNVYGIYLAGSHDNYLENNICENNTEYGIIMTGNTGTRLIHNTIRSNGIYGLLVWGGENNEIIENTFTQNTSRAIVLTQSSRNNLISGNDIHDCYAGIRVWTSSNNRIVNNTLTNGTSSAIMIDHDSTQNLVSENRCENFIYGSGIQLWDTGANTISNNTLSQNSVGIGLQNTVDCVVSNNTCTLNTDSGITASMESQNNQIFENICTGNDMGMGLYDVLNNRIYLNTISSNPGEGIGLFSSTANEIYQNTVSASNYGMMINHSTDNRLYLNTFTGNSQQVYSVNSANIWVSAQAIAYFYQGSFQSEILGNFYADHDLTDTDGNGITDQPYDLAGTEPDDAYPLAMAHENYSLTPGNYDTDRDVDGLDLATFIISFSGAQELSDLNQDQTVNELDIQVFAENFGQ